MNMLLAVALIDSLIAGVAGVIGAVRLLGAGSIGRKVTGALLIATSAMFSYFSVNNFRLHSESLTQENASPPMGVPSMPDETMPLSAPPIVGGAIQKSDKLRER